MKKHLIIIAAALFTQFSYAQGTVSKAYIEQTSVSPKIGFSVGIENKYGFEYGGFYQEASLANTLVSADVKSNLPRIYEEEFMGLYGAAPLVNNQQFDLKLNVRTGVVNGENFSITPSLLGHIHAGEHIKIGTGIGIRSFRPTYQGSISLVL